MFDIDKTIDAFRRGRLDIDCKRMVLTQHKEGGERFEGQGYIRQSDDGTLVFKIYVVHHNAKILEHMAAELGSGVGKLYPDEMYYDLDATGHDGTHWTASRILSSRQWNVSDNTILLQGNMQSATAKLNLSPKENWLRLHFFEEYDVPLTHMSETKENGNHNYVRDRAEFELCGSKFEVRCRKGSGDTVVTATSETAFPVAFYLRIQEAIQYITAKTAIWRARLENENEQLHLELVSPRQKAIQTQLSTPISSGSNDFNQYGWKLFERYLSYVIRNTEGIHWNPVAYHLYNACEATASSLDARAASVSIAVEAITSLVKVEDEEKKNEPLKLLQKRAKNWLKEQTDSEEVKKRMEGLVDSMSKKRPDDALYALSKSGYIEEAYIQNWRKLRNRHVHPSLKDLKILDPVDYQELVDNIDRVETLLRQLTFYLIGYEGPFTDYGAPGEQAFLSKQYPLLRDKYG